MRGCKQRVGLRGMYREGKREGEKDKVEEYIAEARKGRFCERVSMRSSLCSEFVRQL